MNSRGVWVERGVRGMNSGELWRELRLRYGMNSISPIERSLR